MDGQAATLATDSLLVRKGHQGQGFLCSITACLWALNEALKVIPLHNFVRDITAFLNC